MIMTTAAWYSRLSWENSGQKLKKGTGGTSDEKMESSVDCFGMFAGVEFIDNSSLFRNQQEIIFQRLF